MQQRNSNRGGGWAALLGHLSTRATGRALSPTKAWARAGVKSFQRTPHYPSTEDDVRHDEARFVPARHRRTVTNVAPLELQRVLRDRTSGTVPNFPVWTHQTWVKQVSQTTSVKMPVQESWMGRYLTSGAYGMVYATRLTSDVRRVLNNLRQKAWYRVRGTDSLPQTETDLIVKIAVDTEHDDFELSNIREALVHRYLESAPCVSLPGMRTSLCVSHHVPKLYFSGMVACVDPRDNKPGKLFVTVMARAPGSTTKNLMVGSRNTISAKAYVAIERAAAALWVNGIAHNDFHKGNYFVEPSTGRVTIIDFGFAAIMPPELAQAVRHRVAEAVTYGVRCLGEVWRRNSRFGTELQEHMNRVQYTRFKKEANAKPLSKMWYNPDGTALQQLYNKMSQTDRTTVPALRAALWGAAVNRPRRFRMVPVRQQRRNATTSGRPSPPRTPMNVNAPAALSNTRAGRHNGVPMNRSPLSRRQNVTPMNVNSMSRRRPAAAV